MTVDREFAIHSSRVVTSNGVAQAAVVVQGQRIRAIQPLEQLPPALPVEHFEDLVVMSGLVDAHVHVNEPGRTEWEGFETATKSALAGGVTTIIDMPLNSSPVTTDVEAFHAKLAAAEDKCWCDVGFYGGLVPGNAAEVGQLLDEGVWGIKAFLCPSGLDAFPAVGEADLRRAMVELAQRRVPLLVHAELPTKRSAMLSSELAPELDSELSGSAESPPEHVRSYGLFCDSRPEHWEVDAVMWMIELCRTYQCPVHIVHLSSAAALPPLAAAKQAGLPITIETCPHYLFFSSEEIADGETVFKCAPPIRGAANRERLWQGLRSGCIDTIGTDHSPCPPQMKYMARGNFTAAWGGIASLQFGLSSVWTAAERRGQSLAEVVHWMAEAPAQFLGLESKGALEVGKDADLVVWDPEQSWTVEPRDVLHRHSVSPYIGQKLNGRVRRTYLRGQLVYDKGHFESSARGTVLRRGGSVRSGRGRAVPSEGA